MFSSLALRQYSGDDAAGLYLLCSGRNVNENARLEGSVFGGHFAT